MIWKPHMQLILWYAEYFFLITVLRVLAYAFIRKNNTYIDMLAKICFFVAQVVICFKYSLNCFVNGPVVLLVLSA